MLRNFFILAFLARFKKAVTPSFGAAFFLLPVFLLALGLIFNQSTGLTIRAGVLAPETALAQRVVSLMRYYGQKDCEIVSYADEEQMKRDVAAHRLECAYVLPAAVGETDGAIRTYRSPMTVTDKVLDLIVAAAYLETMAGELGAEVLTPYQSDMTADAVTDTSTDTGRAEIAEMAADIQSRAEEYLRDGALMEMVLIESGADTTASEEALNSPYRRLFHGLTGLFALLLALLCAMGLAGDTDKAVLNRIKSTGRGGGGYGLAGCAVVFVAVALFLCLTVTAGGWVYPGLAYAWPAEVVMALAYAWALAGVSALLAGALRADAFPALISFVFIFAALLGGVFFDIREVLRAAGFTRFLFLNYYYLDGITHTAVFPWQQASLLAGVGLVAGALALRVTRAGR